MLSVVIRAKGAPSISMGRTVHEVRDELSTNRSGRAF